MREVIDFFRTKKTNDKRDINLQNFSVLLLIGIIVQLVTLLKCNKLYVFSRSQVINDTMSYLLHFIIFCFSVYAMARLIKIKYFKKNIIKIVLLILLTLIFLFLIDVNKLLVQGMVMLLLASFFGMISAIIESFARIKFGFVGVYLLFIGFIVINIYQSNPYRYYKVLDLATDKKEYNVEYMNDSFLLLKEDDITKTEIKVFPIQGINSSNYSIISKNDNTFVDVAGDRIKNFKNTILIPISNIGNGMIVFLKNLWNRLLIHGNTNTVENGGVLSGN